MRTPRILTGLALACALGWSHSVAWATLQTIAVQGEDSPRAGVDPYKNLNPPAVSDNDGGTLASLGQVKDAGKLKKCIFRLGDTTDEATVCVLDVSPVVGSPAFRRLNDPSINTGGTIAWGAILTGQASAVFRDPAAGAISTVALEGDTVRVAGINGAFLDEIEDLVAIADNGDVAFQAFLIPPPGNTVRTDAIFICSGGGHCSAVPNALESIVARNTLIPDPNDLIPKALRFCSFTRLAASNFGVAFIAQTKEDCNDQGEDFVTGLFRAVPGAPPTVETLALEGRDALPGGSLYFEIGGFIAMNNSGTVAFKSSVKRNFGLEDILYLCDTTCAVKTGGILAQIAVKVGDTDGTGKIIRNLSAPNIDSTGNVGFSAEVRDPVTNKTLSAVYKRDTGGVLTTLAIKGTTAVPAPAILDTFTNLFGRRLGMSASGRVGFKAVVTGPYPVPQPAKKDILLLDE
jgi:hypothetical protein